MKTNNPNQLALPSAEQPQNDWKQVLVEIIFKILTLGFYHIKKHQNR